VIWYGSYESKRVSHNKNVDLLENFPITRFKFIGKSLHYHFHYFSSFFSYHTLLNPTMSYPTSERVKCVLWYESSRSCISVQRKFRTEFHKDPPSAKTIRKWHTSLMERGSVLSRKRHQPKSALTQENVQIVQQHFQTFPLTSIRRASTVLHISRPSIHRILRTLTYHPYKMQMVQKLYAEDKVNRVNFAQDELTRLMESPCRLRQLTFSDEAHFHLDGGVNRHNFRYWSNENPQWTSEVALHSQRTTVWAAIWKDGIIGPFFFDANVTSERYLELLKDQFWPKVAQLGLQADMIFMQDGAPPRWGKSVRCWLNEHFPGRWIGRGSPTIQWPPRSPDLTPCDFFLWGFIKSKVYSTRPADIPELKRRIQKAFTLITREMLCHVFEAFTGRLHRTLDNRGCQVEVEHI
jgi:hypothetical protein